MILTAQLENVNIFLGSKNRVDHGDLELLDILFAGLLQHGHCHGVILVDDLALQFEGIVEHEGDQNHHDDQLHAHDFFRVGNAPHAPDHQTHKIGEAGHRVEGKAAVLRRWEMAEGVLHRHAALHHQRGNVRLTAARYIGQSKRNVHRGEDIVDTCLGGMVVDLDRRFRTTGVKNAEGKTYLRGVLSRKDSDCQPCGRRRWSLFLQIFAFELGNRIGALQCKHNHHSKQFVFCSYQHTQYS